MEIETFVLCDAAVDYLGKLSLLGTFDSITASSFPMVWPHCTVALRIRFSPLEEGEHRVRIGFSNADGQAFLPPMEGGITVRFPPGARTAPANLILNIQSLKIEQAGEYSIDLAVDGRHEKTLPLYVRLRPEKASPPDARGPSAA